MDVAGCKRIMRAADAADRKVNINFGFQRRYGQGYIEGESARRFRRHRKDPSGLRALHQEWRA